MGDTPQPTAARQVYQAPTVTDLGTLHDLTQQPPINKQTGSGDGLIINGVVQATSFVP